MREHSPWSLIKSAQRYVQGERKLIDRYKVVKDKRTKDDEYVQLDEPIEVLEYLCPWPQSCSSGPLHRVVIDPWVNLRVDVRHMGRSVAVGIWPTEADAFSALESAARLQVAS